VNITVQKIQFSLEPYDRKQLRGGKQKDREGLAGRSSCTIPQIDIANIPVHIVLAIILVGRRHGQASRFTNNVKSVANSWIMTVHDYFLAR
jgi:hypothetical protein